uniref:histidine kinase n=1 Tax=Magnetococcus massalia (strain MO-1) TaxID=451514 RepID=A0A1S7LJ40_MAGMO|nr:putative integral membrane sensor signal transduction histidine kinase [Candidatus Magnetococcus massalia]
MKWRPWPHSLAGQMVWILFIGVTLALISSAAIHLYDRNEAMVQMEGLQAAQRFASIVQVMEPLTPAERAKLAPILKTSNQFVALVDAKDAPQIDHSTEDARAGRLKRLIARYLEGEHPILVEVLPTSTEQHPMQGMRQMMRHRHHMAGGGPLFNHGFSYIARVQLSDGRWLAYHNHLPEEAFIWPWHLLWSILILIVVVTALAFLAVRLVTRPLARLAGAARALGHDLRSPPLDQSGSREVREVVTAFNAMQARIVQHVQERSAMLAAVSHDLHTPLTRMRLRVEMLKEAKLRDALLGNLTEMENMTESAMDYIQGSEGMEEVRLTDLPSLLEELEESWREIGQDVTVQCCDLSPFPLMPRSFRRALSNLIQNGVKYGKRVEVKATMHGERLRISVADQGPGIPEDQMERMLRPFKRLDASRNSKTGGTGLGLSIVDSIVQAHGGKLTMRNRPEGGLEVILTISKKAFLS